LASNLFNDPLSTASVQQWYSAFSIPSELSIVIPPNFVAI